MEDHGDVYFYLTPRIEENSQSCNVSPALRLPVPELPFSFPLSMYPCLSLQVAGKQSESGRDVKVAVLCFSGRDSETVGSAAAKLVGF